MIAKHFQWFCLTDRTPQPVYNAVLKVRERWTVYDDEELSRNTDRLIDEFGFFAGGDMHYCKQKFVE